MTRPRWQAPLNTVWVEDHPTRNVIMADGEERRDVNVIFNEDTFKRLMNGYLCISCFEPCEHAFPERCKLCGFQMRAEQPHRIEHEFEGYSWVGPSRETVEAMNEQLDDHAFRSARRAGIVIPRGVGAS